MSLKPIVRYMLLCDDWQMDPRNGRRISILGLISNIRLVEEPFYPLLCEQICVFLILTEGRGQGDGQIVCIFEETGRKIFETNKKLIVFGSDPLEVTAVPFRIWDCSFPFPGRYLMQFWYSGELLEERPFLMR